MSFVRPNVGHLLVAARGELRLATAYARRVMWSVLSISGWAVFAILMGSVVGFSAVVFPPSWLAAIIGTFLLILLWVLPDGFPSPDRLIRYAVFVVAVVDLTLPTYYTIQILGLPWISARRVVTLVLVLLFGFAYSTSREARERIAEVVRDNRLLYICAGGYLGMVFLANFTSVTPLNSIAGMVDVILEWYIPFIAVTYVARSDKDVAIFIRVLCCCALVVSLIGLWDSYTMVRHYVEWMPQWVVQDLARNNPSFANLSTTLEMRDGMYRASSLYNSSLSFAEFVGMASPFGAMYIVHGRGVFDRIFGVVILAACLGGIYISGSRGGWLSFIVASGVLLSLFVVRNSFIQPRSITTPVFGALVTVAGAGFLALLFASHRIHDSVIGGASTANSNAARSEQWHMAWPKIFANPVTGYGYLQSGIAIGYTSPNGTVTVDSFLLTLLTETGVPSVMFFFGAAIVASYTAGRRYVRDPSPSGAFGGALAASIAAFTAYRFFLSQRENMTLFYVMMACAALLYHFYLQSKRQEAGARLARADAPERNAPRRRPAPHPAPASVARQSGALNR
jgi:hypothetical protein